MGTIAQNLYVDIPSCNQTNTLIKVGRSPQPLWPINLDITIMLVKNTQCSPLIKTHLDIKPCESCVDWKKRENEVMCCDQWSVCGMQVNKLPNISQIIS